MIKRIIRFSAENRYLVIAGTLVVLALSAWTMRNIRLDALPDLSDTQVIVYSRWDRSPDIIEDQLTYPITTALLGAPKVKSIADLEKLVLKAEGGTPVTVKDVATVSIGPEMRRGVADLDGEGDVVGGIVVMRYGENALNVIERVKTKLAELRPSLPKGVEIVTTYDRSDLI